MPAAISGRGPVRGISTTLARLATIMTMATMGKNASPVITGE